MAVDAEAKNTFSSIGGASGGFKWSINNKALGPAFLDDKENGNVVPSDSASNGQVGVVGVRSLILGARG